MAETFLFTLTERVVSKLSSIAAEEISLAWDIKTELNKLNNTLSTIKAVLLDAHQHQGKSYEVKDWLDKLQDAVYDVDELLDVWSTRILLRKANNSLITTLGKFFSSSNPVVFRFKVGYKVKEIRERLEQIAADRRNFHFSGKIVTVMVSQVDNKPREQTHSYVQSSDIIGRDKEKDSVVELLRNSKHDNENISVIPIVGLGGLGKTTLVKLVYTDPWVVQYFGLRMWVSISQEFSLNKVIEKIIKSATGESSGNLDMDQMQAQLRGVLNGKRFLLVLDDVWDEDRNKWIDFMELLIINGCEGSKVVVTTRSVAVARITGTTPPFNLSGLSEDDSLTLFLKYAFKGEEDQLPNLVAIGKEIVKKSGGVPLAVKTLGSLLYMKSDEREWLHIRDNDLWEIEQKENDILPILRLTYQQMPSYLRQCFAYCCMLPKDFEVPREVFVNLWIAQGFITLPPNGSRRLEDVGNQYFNELLSLFCFQDVVEAFDGEILACKIHSLVHDLAQSVAGAEYSTGSRVLPERVRHLLFHSESFEGKEFPRVLLKSKKLRSFFYHCEVPFVGKIKTSVKVLTLRFECLRVLYLESLELDELPSSISKLQQLRYLNLSKSYRIKYLPDSFCNLVNLQTLDLINCEQLEKLPRNMGKLVNLNTLYLTSKQNYFPGKRLESLNSLRFLLLFKCRCLESLSEGFHGFKALRVLRIYECPNLAFLPSSIKYLTSLEKLWIWKCEKLSLMEGEGMEGLKGLRSLLLMGLPKLTTLPGGLKHTAAMSLQYLRISDCSNLTNLPEWLQNFTSLLRLYVEDCPNLISIPQGVRRLTAKVHIIGCPQVS